MDPSSEKRLQYKSLAMKIRSEATITCPSCGFSKVEAMPTDACQHSYRCQGCGELLRRKSGKCCVFCSYGDTRCPPKQAEAA
jgi:transposase-like protein